MQSCIQITAFIFGLCKYKSNPWNPLKDPTKHHAQKKNQQGFERHVCVKSSHCLYQASKWWLLIRHMTFSIMRVMIMCPPWCFVFPPGCFSFPLFFYFSHQKISRLSTVLCVENVSRKLQLFLFCFAVFVCFLVKPPLTPWTKRAK